MARTLAVFNYQVTKISITESSESGNNTLEREGIGFFFVFACTGLGLPIFVGLVHVANGRLIE